MRHNISLALWLCLATSAAGAAGLPYDEVSLGKAKVKLPTLGFVVACDENDQYKASLKAMTPADSDFVTCMVGADKWKAATSGVPTELRPVIVVLVGKTPPGGGFTAQEFAMIRAKAYAEPAKVAPSNGDSFKGFIETPSTTTSFSFLVEGPGPTPTGHVKSASSIYYAGHLLEVLILDVATDNVEGRRTKDFTLDWLRAFQSLNAPSSDR